MRIPVVSRRFNVGLLLTIALLCLPCQNAQAGPKAGDKIYLILNITATGDYRETHSGTYEPKGTHEIQTSDHFQSTCAYRATWKVKGSCNKESDQMELELVTDSYDFTCGGNGSTRKYDEYWAMKGEPQQLKFDRSELIMSNWTYPSPKPAGTIAPSPIFSVRDKTFTLTNIPNLPLLVVDNCMPKCDTTTTMKDDKGTHTYKVDAGTGIWAHTIAGIANMSVLGVQGQASEGMDIQKMKSDMKAAAAKAGVKLDAAALQEIDNAQMSAPSLIRDNSVKDKLTGTWPDPGKPFSITQTATYQASDKDMERVSGEKQEPATCCDDDSISSSQSGNLILSYTLSYNMEPEELEAVIIPPDGYDSKWLPQGGADEETPGTDLSVQVKLQVKGKPKQQPSQGAQFTYRLTGVSSEPGTCLNFPQSGAKSTKDLRIRQEDNSELEVKDKGMTAVTTAADLTKSSVTLQCYDWGAYGSLHVTAQLEDGRKIEAHMQGKGFSYLPIPMDENSNLVADAWENEQGIKGKAANADDENQPKGDSHEGDGLTVYEEYRGIIEDGKHIRCNPVKKDFFVCVKPDEKKQPLKAADPGLAMFANLSGLEVHSKLTLDELGPDRVINRNSPERQIGQHGVILEKDPELSGIAKVFGSGPGTPKHATRVGVAPDMLTGGEGAPNVAHELLHACSVHHHGYGDRTDRVWVRERDPKNPKNTIIMEYIGKKQGDKTVPDYGKPGYPAHVYLETGGVAPLASFKVGEVRDFQIGVKHGEHSGDERCIMRYNNAQAYVSDREKNNDPFYIRNVIADHMPGDGIAGTILCTSTVGIDFNKSGRKPEPRYGSAQDGLGNCLAQICVNDKHDHTPVEIFLNGQTTYTRSKN